MDVLGSPPFSPAGCTHPSDTPSARTQRGLLGFSLTVTVECGVETPLYYKEPDFHLTSTRVLHTNKSDCDVLSLSSSLSWGGSPCSHTRIYLICEGICY
ncbi:hypothetical protein Pelo_3033 [Pelomyxa schiedti]|nr:hypothetical protein Pelo_3033 [Pelomyxa schiedti]